MSLHKRIIIGTLALLASALFFDISIAQGIDDQQPGRERLEVAKITFISRQLKLTPQEARLFWPVYDEYQEQMKIIRHQRAESFSFIGDGLENLSDNQINEIIDTRLRNAEMALEAKKKLITDLRDFLPPRRILIFLRAEQQFNNELQQRVANRRR